MPTAPVLLTAQPAAPSRWRHRLLLELLLVVALPLLTLATPRYEAAGVMIAPLAPALALALCAAARIGWRALPAVVAGAALAAGGWPLALPSALDTWAAATLVAQVGFGGLLLRRSGRPDDLALDNAKAIRRWAAAALAMAVIGGLAEVAGDLLWASSASARPGLVGLVRAVADGASVLLLAPIILAFAAPQRERWRARRRSVALPLAVLALLLWGAFAGIDGRDRQQAQDRFERDADIVFAHTQARLDAPRQAVLALHGALQAAKGDFSPALFDVLARPWLERSAGVINLGWIDSPPRSDGGAPASPGATASPAASKAALTLVSTQDDGPIVVRHVLQATPSAEVAALQASVLASPALRAGLLEALIQARPVVSRALALSPAAEDRNGFVILQALPAAADAGRRPVVFATVVAEPLVAPVLASRTDALRACLFDTDTRAERRRLAGAGGCESAAPRENSFSREAAFDFGGRHWAMRISQPVRTPGGVWLFALPALAGSALLAMLLAAMTGRVQRAEAAAHSNFDAMQRALDDQREEHEHNEHLLQSMLDTVQVGVALIDTQGRVQRANPAFAELAGCSPQALVRQPIDELLVDDDHPMSQRIAQLMRDAGDGLQHLPLRLRNQAGRVVPALVALRVLRDADGRASAAVCALHDLSDNLRRRQAERVLDDVINLGRDDERS